MLSLPLLVLLFSLSGAVQNTDSIAGTVSDPNGAAVQSANVTARRGAEVYTTTTNEEGKFLFANLASGNYALTVAASGFRVLTQEVAASGTGDLQINLTVANPAATVVVQAEVDLYLADTSTTGTKLDIPQRDLPQSISVVPRSIINDRALVRLTEAGEKSELYLTQDNQDALFQRLFSAAFLRESSAMTSSIFP